jgi:D-amino-acid dehydrogenase
MGQHAVIVGGGVIGAACAHYLRQAGLQVTIVEKQEFGSGCSHGNCGLICPSHVLPLAGPGAAWATLRTLFQPNSPLKVRLRWDPALWSWLLGFAGRCNQRDLLAGGRAIQGLLNSSRALYEGLFHSELHGVEWESRGLLFVFRTAAGLEHFTATEQLLRNEFGLAATCHAGAALQELEPALHSDLAGGWHFETDGHLRPDKLLRAWRGLLESRGVQIREHSPLTSLKSSGRQVTAVVTPAGELAADVVVVAAGAWTPQLERELRCVVPIQPGKGYSLTLPRPERPPRIPLIFEEHRVAVTPFETGYRIGSTMEFAGYDTSLNRGRLRLLRESAALYLKERPAEPVLEEWWGWRPMTPDSVPLIGRCPAFENVYLAAGHNMLGLSMAPATGKLIAELVRGESPHVDPAPYAVGRWQR